MLTGTHKSSYLTQAVRLFTARWFCKIVPAYVSFVCVLCVWWCRHEMSGFSRISMPSLLLCLRPCAGALVCGGRKLHETIRAVEENPGREKKIRRWRSGHSGLWEQISSFFAYSFHSYVCVCVWVHYVVTRLFHLVLNIIWRHCVFFFWGR